MRESRPDHALRLEARALDEPQLVFNGQHRHIDPKAGLEIGIGARMYEPRFSFFDLFCWSFCLAGC